MVPTSTPMHDPFADLKRQYDAPEPARSRGDDTADIRRIMRELTTLSRLARPHGCQSSRARALKVVPFGAEDRAEAAVERLAPDRQTPTNRNLTANP